MLREEMRAEKDGLEVALSKHKAAVLEAQDEMYKAINRLVKPAAN